MTRLFLVSMMDTTKLLYALAIATTILLYGCANPRLAQLERDVENVAIVVLGLDARVADLEQGREWPVFIANGRGR